MIPGIPCYTHDKKFRGEFEHLILLNYYFNLNMYPFNFIYFLFLFIKSQPEERIALPFLETNTIFKWTLIRDQ